jgi:hypothetical protein
MIVAGNYPEALTISKPLTIQSFGGSASIGR